MRRANKREVLVDVQQVGWSLVVVAWQCCAAQSEWVKGASSSVQDAAASSR